MTVRTQDLHEWLDDYRSEFADDVLVVPAAVGRVQDITALALGLWGEGAAPLIVCPRSSASTGRS